MSYEVIHANALSLPLEDESVDLICTSPPYWALRSYRDGDEHYEDQVGSEATPQEFLEALWAATREMVRVLKPSGSIWVNLGDKYAGSGGHNNSAISAKSTLQGNGHVGGGPKIKSTLRNAPDRYNQNTGGIPAKSLMGLPWRYAIGCVDQLGLILRAEVIWSKPNGLPESVTDRVRRSHEQWFHFTKQGRYFAAVDEVREPYLLSSWTARSDAAGTTQRGQAGIRSGAKGRARAEGAADGSQYGTTSFMGAYDNPLGKLPGSVWTVPSEPLIVPEHLGLPDHFAAFPQEWPRRIILGWSPTGICTACGEGRRPVVEVEYQPVNERLTNNRQDGLRALGHSGKNRPGTPGAPHGDANRLTTITGYSCACTPYTDHPEWRGKDWRSHRATDEGARPTTPERPTGERNPGGTREYHLAGWTPPPTTPARVLDVFGGTGTVAGVAHALGRHGISVDLSADYCRLAEWRIGQSGHFQKAYERSAAEGAQVPLVAPKDTAGGRQSLFDEAS